MPYSEQTLLARAGRGGDNRIVHATDGDVVISRERQERDPNVRKQLRDLIGDDLEKFTVGSAWNSKNPDTGLAEFADTLIFSDQPPPANTPSTASTTPSVTSTTPAASTTPPAPLASTPASGSAATGQTDPWSDIFTSVVSGAGGGGGGKGSAPAGAPNAPTAAEALGAGDTGGPGNPGGGQPGSASREGAFSGTNIGGAVGRGIAGQAASALAGGAFGPASMAMGVIGALAQAGVLGPSFGNKIEGFDVDALGRTGGVSSTSGQQLGDALAASSVTSDQKNLDLSRSTVDALSGAGVDAGPQGIGGSGGSSASGPSPGGSAAVGIDGQGFGGGTGGSSSSGGSEAGPGGEAGTATDLWTLSNPMGTVYNSGTIITRLERREA